MQNELVGIEIGFFSEEVVFFTMNFDSPSIVLYIVTKVNMDVLAVNNDFLCDK